ncbi:MAG TPA: restriction endonuclease subunit S, partial [Candidatus Binatia bacterium]|nr:restriction endonuclease subunit S [Candidatus Binatia bacterium]
MITLPKSHAAVRGERPFSQPWAISRELLLRHFEALGDTPDAITKLRALVLELAIRGRLTPQDQSEPRPSFQKIEELTNESGELPFVSPPNWTLLRLGQALILEYGANLPARSRNIDGKYPVYGSNGIVGRHDEFLVEPPCIIVGRKGSSGAVNLSEGRCWPTDVAYYAVPPKPLDLRFTFYLLKALRLDLLGKGIKPGLNRNEAYRLLIAVPPLAEQRRIVAKVEELLALCDELEARQTAAHERRTRLVHSALDHLTAAKDEQDFRKQCSFILHNSSPILDSVPALRQAILSLAVQGRLVPQNATQDGTAEQALNERRSRLKSDGASHKGARNEFRAVDENNMPMTVPGNWKWIRFGVSGHSKPARKGQMKTGHFESGIAPEEAIADLMRDEPTQRESATFHR